MLVSDGTSTLQTHKNKSDLHCMVTYSQEWEATIHRHRFGFVTVNDFSLIVLRYDYSTRNNSIPALLPLLYHLTLSLATNLCFFLAGEYIEVILVVVQHTFLIFIYVGSLALILILTVKRWRSNAESKYVPNQSLHTTISEVARLVLFNVCSYRGCGLPTN